MKFHVKYQKVLHSKEVQYGSYLDFKCSFEAAGKEASKWSND